MFNNEVPKVLINLTDNADHGFPFDDKKNFPERLFYQGKCDDVISEIVKSCGWEEDLNQRISKDKKDSV